MDLYRIIILPSDLGQIRRKEEKMVSESRSLQSKNVTQSKMIMGVSNDGDGPKVCDEYSGLGSLAISTSNDSKLDMNSVSSSASSSKFGKVSYSNVVQEFKSAIGQRNTPWNLRKLNFILIAILALSLICSSVDYSLKLSYMDYESRITELLVSSQSRSVKFTQIVQNIRSMLNIANGIEFARYADKSLSRVNRFDYLRAQILT